MLKRLALRVGPFGKAHWPDLLFITVFVVSRLVYRGKFGIHFDASPLYYFIQYIDPWFLEHDFWRSVLYVTHQAPLPNLVVGAAYLAFGPYWFVSFFELVFAGLGLVFGLTLLRVLERVGVARLFAAPLVCFFLATPAAILYENWLFYHLPVAVAFTASLLALFAYYRSGTLRAGLLFFSCLALVALIRNVYGAVWLGAILGAIVLVPPLAAPRGRSARMTALRAAALPLLVVFAAGVKGKLLTGHDAGSAGVWTNIVYKTWPLVPSAERERLTKEHVLDDTVAYEPFTTPDALNRRLRVKVEPTGVPLLDMARAPNGRANTHTLEYLLIADEFYKRDGKLLLKHYPDAYAASVADALFNWYPSSPTRDIVLPQTVNYERVKRLDAKLNQLAGANGDGRLLALVIALPAALLYGIYRLVRTKAHLASERTIVAMILFMVLTIVYAALGTTLVSSGDFSRYRYDVDPFYLVLCAMLTTDATSALRRVYRRARS